MKNIVIVAAVVGLVGGVAWFKNKRGAESCCPAPAAVVGADGRPLPKLIEIGGGTCPECKKMAPIIAELAREYAGRVDVQSIDISEDRAAQYRWWLIPTQLFIDAEGNEFHRNEGAWSKQAIVAKLQEMGVPGPHATSRPAPTAAASAPEADD